MTWAQSVMPSRAGSPNKNKAFLLNRLQDMYGDEFHPIMRMAEQAAKLHNHAAQSEDTNDLKASIDAWDKIAQYTEPKLKATEIDLYADVTVDHPNTIRLVAELPDDE
jgi:hypothetical protein